MRTVMIEDNTSQSLVDITKVSFCHRIYNQVEIIVDGIRVTYQYNDRDDAATALKDIMIAMREYEAIMCVPNYTYTPETITWPSTTCDSIIYTTGTAQPKPDVSIDWEYVNATYEPSSRADAGISLDRNFGGKA